ncbi:glycosyltransferase [Photobacterium kishitanii]|uniref:glycosyltransferase n=1 Tax=Photobacterium kishitanii TaxID=318456 RepID=UPI000D153FD4|nr:glycosyltransferase [Photobacterium kishitanii]PSU14103.1 glycosyl transferase [Photobacterium kishitanii]
MKITILSRSDSRGGAARAAYRLQKALLKDNVDVKFLTSLKLTDDYVITTPKNKNYNVISTIKSRLGQYFLKLSKTENKNFHSINILPSNWSRQINNNDSDIINLHWVGDEMISVEDIGKINKKIIWTLHDMWPFCGCEHVTSDCENSRWREGYNSLNRSKEDKGIDLDKFNWNRKKRSWKQSIHFVAPSHWLAKCVKDSALFKDSIVSVIPNALDTNVFKPLSKHFCRNILNLPQDKKIILFGAMGGGADHNKGYDLLISSLNDLSIGVDNSEILCVIFGQGEPENKPDIPFSCQWMGHIHDDSTLALLYNCADIMVVPSRVENLPQTATEAHSCGIPVVAFNCTGIPDVIKHKETGYLAKAYDINDFSFGIKWILGSKVLQKSLGENARKRAVKLWDYAVISEQYVKLYQKYIK